jgi:hypothetical protein
MPNVISNKNMLVHFNDTLKGYLYILLAFYLKLKKKTFPEDTFLLEFLAKKQPLQECTRNVEHNHNDSFCVVATIKN